jgi:succinoglycan biosynthesis protein ExoA
MAACDSTLASAAEQPIQRVDGHAGEAQVAARLSSLADCDTASWPSVSIVVPVLNEERYIHACLRAILAQDYPTSQLEVIVVDGMSTDRTAEIVAGIAAEDYRIRLLYSPKRRTPFSMNIGVAAARGDIVVRIDGHSVVPKEHVRQCVEFLLQSGADHVGGLMRAKGIGYVASTIALALSSPFGVGSARFRYTQREQDIDTVPFGAYRRETLIRLGGFDERFFVGQDSEFDYRITLSGGRVRISPAISTDYYCRDSLPRLSRQFFRYGRAKAYILHKHRGLPSPRAFAPAGLLTCIVGLALASPVFRSARRMLVILVACYLLSTAVAGTVVAAKRGIKHAFLMPVVFMVLHLSHGAGFLAGLPRFTTPRPIERLHGSLDVTNGTALADSTPTV